MKNTFGNNLSVTLFGESHGECIGAVIDGLAPGIRIDDEYIKNELTKRRPSGRISTSRVEGDFFRIVSGTYDGRTTGTPLCILIPNSDTRSSDYSEMSTKARPGHADYTAHVKYNGFNDVRGGGHTSGRITAAYVAAGAVASYALKEHGIITGTHILECAGVRDRNFSSYTDDITAINLMNFAVLDSDAGERMRTEIEKAASECDSVGGILETAVTGVPAGVGEPWFDSVESMLSHALFSVPGIKGVEFGAGFGFAGMRGSTANDSFHTDGNTITTTTNNNGGINGGITNGMPIIFRCAVKPTPSISCTQNTVDFVSKENAQINIRGRHDPAIIHRARAVVDAATALVLYDLIAGHFGNAYFGGKR